MGWQDRDYSRAAADIRRIDRGAYLPGRGVTGLLMMHVAAFVLILILSGGAQTDVLRLFVLVGPSPSLAAIVLHPLANPSFLELFFVAFVIWSLGSRIEEHFGTRRLIVLYVVGNLSAGVVFVLCARLFPALAGYPLVIPLGAFAAWALLAWRELYYDAVSVFGKVITLSTAIAIGAAGVAAGTILGGGLISTGAWFLSGAAGALAGSLRRLSRAARESREQERIDPLDIDDVLAKISRDGIGALTPTERERLERARSAKLHGGGSG